MKTTIKGIATATFIAVLLIVGNVKATESKTSNSGIIEVEETLRMENWMTNENIWNSNFVNIAEIAVEAEQSMELENWMTNEEVWNANRGFVEEVEMKMELEEWMTNYETWNTVKNEVESALTVEPWMINDNFWK